MGGYLTIEHGTNKPLTETVDGYDFPANYSFSCVNDYVHDAGREFEELQYLCLGLATALAKLTKKLNT